MARQQQVFIIISGHAFHTRRRILPAREQDMRSRLAKPQYFFGDYVSFAATVDASMGNLRTSPSGLLRPGLSPPGLSPPGFPLAGLRVAGLRVAGLRVVGLPFVLAWLQALLDSRLSGLASWTLASWTPACGTLGRGTPGRGRRGRDSSARL